MFLIHSLTQVRKLAGLFLLPIYRVCMKSMVSDCFWSPCTQFFRYTFLLYTTGRRSSRRL